MPNTPVGVLGAGKMGASLVKGWLRQGLLKCGDIHVYDVSEAACDALVSECSVRKVKTPEALAKSCSTLVLAVKPKDVPACLKAVSKTLSSKHLLLSIAAGVNASSLSKLSGGQCRVVRVMPNMAALVGEAASAYCLGPRSTEEDGQRVEKLLSAIGTSVRVQDADMDAVTGLSGSGPGYAFVIIEALADAGVLEGLSRDVALQLAAQTLVGAGRLLLVTGKHPGQLKDEVASPGGTTVRGLKALADGKVRAALMNAVSAATERSRELSKSSD